MIARLRRLFRKRRGLTHETDTQFEAESLNFLLAQAREELGVNLLVPGGA